MSDRKILHGMSLRSAANILDFFTDGMKLKTVAKRQLSYFKYIIEHTPDI